MEGTLQKNFHTLYLLQKDENQNWKLNYYFV